MARPLRNLTIQIIVSSSTSSSLSMPIAFFSMLLSIFSIVSIISFLCASHKNSRSKGSQLLVKEETNNEKSSHKRLLSNSNISSSSKALLKTMSNMVSCRKIQVEGEEEDEDYEKGDGAVWKKSIMMGERCRPLEFSGKIVYDSHGNLLPEKSKPNQNFVLGKS